VCFAAVLGLAQQAPPNPSGAAAEAPGGEAQPSGGEFTLPPGTKVPLSLINTISTKHSVIGDRVYLETAFPVLSGGRIVVPVGSYVAGTVTQIKKPGRVKGRGELYVRFDSITLPNGVTREFRARLGGVDGQATGELDRAEGMVKSEGNKAGDARIVGEAAGAGASVGVIASRTAMGAGIGAAAGAAAGLIGVLITRGPDAVLPRGSTVEMVLDRPLRFTDAELVPPSTQPAQPSRTIAPAAALPPDAAKNSAKRWPW
jgi:type IV secretion system protein VirB10